MHFKCTRGKKTEVKIVSCVIALLGLLLFLTFATYPLDAAVASLIKRIRRKVGK